MQGNKLCLHANFSASFLAFFWKNNSCLLPLFPTSLLPFLLFNFCFVLFFVVLLLMLELGEIGYSILKIVRAYKINTLRKNKEINTQSNNT